MAKPTKKSQLRQYVESHGVNFQTYISRKKRGKTNEEALSLAKDRSPKLTKDDVKNIKALIHEREVLKSMVAGLTDSEISKKFGVARSTITGIGSGLLHRDIK